MKFSIEGRLRNMRLPDGRTAMHYSIFEGVSNAVHAIEEYFGLQDAPSKGQVLVVIEKDNDKLVRKVTISDNGVGLNERHLASFNTCDTTEKADIGGRGVGRLVWFKVFTDVQIRSTFEAGGSRQAVAFTFDPFQDDSLVDLAWTDNVASECGTHISLVASAPAQSSKLTPAQLARSLAHHFFPYFIADSMPKLQLRFGKRVVDVGDYLRDRMSVQSSEEVDLSARGLGTLKITHAYVSPSIASDLSNSILLTAQGRVVESIEIEKKFALRNLENRQAYACVVRGDFLDDKVDQERTSFKASEDDIEAIKTAALEAAGRFLKSHIQRVYQTQKRQVVDILEEHPQLAVSVDDVDAYVATLSPGMSDEEIGKSLFTLLYRQEKKVRAEIKALNEVEVVPQEQVDALMDKVNQAAQRRLAEYTVKRHQIIQVARSLLRYTDAQRKTYAWEKAVHDIICPMGRILSSHDYADHNLWIVDDLLSYYQFFASDKTLSVHGIEGERSEPDLLFVNPFGFRREGTNDPVVIVEFKRPGDEYLTSDPVDQVLGYVEKLRQRTVRGPEGEVISDISDRTPFECIVICDLTEGARKKLSRSLAQNPTPDGHGYYGFSKEHNASIRVLSLWKVFRDAEMRHRAFFDRLGLVPEEVRRSLTLGIDALVSAG